MLFISMDEKLITKTPRLYTPLDLKAEAEIVLQDGQAHYLKNVLRKSEGDHIRLFNGRDGEWLAVMTALSKKQVTAICETLLREQSAPPRRIHAIFAPIKKQRMDFLIEKAVELGATDLHPVLTQNTETRKLNTERIEAQIIEAAEQCERLDIPLLHGCHDIYFALKECQFPVLAAIERGVYPDIKIAAKPFEKKEISVFCGPEGGFTKEEIAFLHGQDTIHPVSLGPNILRAETSLLKLLSII